MKIKAFRSNLEENIGSWKHPQGKRPGKCLCRMSYVTPLEKSEFINWDVIDWSVTITLKNCTFLSTWGHSIQIGIYVKGIYNLDSLVCQKSFIFCLIPKSMARADPLFVKWLHSFCVGRYPLIFILLVRNVRPSESVVSSNLSPWLYILYRYPPLHSTCFNLTRQPCPSLPAHVSSLSFQRFWRMRLGINERSEMSSAKKKKVWLMSDHIFFQLLSHTTSDHAYPRSSPSTLLQTRGWHADHYPLRRCTVAVVVTALALGSNFLGSFSVLWRLECQELHF